MKTKGNTILITGGATGIGLAMAEVFLREGNEVIICGRREEKLKEAKNKFPKLHAKHCDVSSKKECQKLFNELTAEFKGLNILINNAGVQRMIDLKKGAEALEGENEIATNFAAPVYLSALFFPVLCRQKEAAIVNVSSGLGFVPMAIMPVYCATKAAVHSFTLSLRRQLRDTSVKVFEIIPPIVDTELDKGARDKRGQSDRGIKPVIVAEEALKALANDTFECAVGGAEAIRAGSRANPEQFFANMNR